MRCVVLRGNFLSFSIPLFFESNYWALGKYSLYQNIGEPHTSMYIRILLLLATIVKATTENLLWGG